MLSLDKLMRNTPKDVIGRSNDVRVGRLKVAQSMRGAEHTFVFDAASNAITEKTFYNIRIELFADPIEGMEGAPVYHMPTAQSRCFVQCECQYFLFNCEYALTRSGNSEIHYSNGRPSYVTNKAKFGKFLPFFCKHLYKAAPLALKACQDKARAYKKFDFID